MLIYKIKITGGSLTAMYPCINPTWLKIPRIKLNKQIYPNVVSRDYILTLACDQICKADYCLKHFKIVYGTIAIYVYV